MSELATALVADSYAASPAHILEGLSEQQAHQRIPNTPHTIFEELWHMAFWQQATLDWIARNQTPFPARPEDGFPSAEQTSAESFIDLRQRFLTGAMQSATVAGDLSHLEDPIRCPSRPGVPTRVMSIRDQLISLATHNAYHLGRIVVLRQLMHVWPPPSGGYSW